MRKALARRSRPPSVLLFGVLTLIVAATLIIVGALRPCALPALLQSRHLRARCVSMGRPLYKIGLKDAVGLHEIDFAYLSRNYGDRRVYAQVSSRTAEDTADGEEAGLAEKSMLLRDFIEASLSSSTRSRSRFDYVKMLDDNFAMRQFMPLGVMIEAELEGALRRRRIALPEHIHWSFWLGAKGSTTSMHFDEQSFNCLLVLKGRKRVVLLDPAFEYECRRPPSNPGACWTGVDLLTAPPPEAQELVLSEGEALLIPDKHWHAVENLEPTLAVGINEFDPATNDIPWRDGTRFDVDVREKVVL